MCIRDSHGTSWLCGRDNEGYYGEDEDLTHVGQGSAHVKVLLTSVSYTHLRAHETVLDLVCRLLLEKTKNKKKKTNTKQKKHQKTAYIRNTIK